jgi:hypothetical protein
LRKPYKFCATGVCYGFVVLEPLREQVKVSSELGDEIREMVERDWEIVEKNDEFKDGDDEWILAEKVDHDGVVVLEKQGLAQSLF